MAIDMDLNNWMKLEEASAAMKTTKVHLLMMIKRGLLRGAEQDGHWYVDPKALATLSTEKARTQLFNHSHCKTPGGCGGCS